VTTFYICRHGLTEFNLQQRLSGQLDTPLLEAGLSSTLAAAKKLQDIKIDKIISSDLGRAFATAYIVARQLNLDNEIIRSKDLREVNYGDLAGMPHKQAEQLCPDLHTNSKRVSPNGESLGAMQARVLNFTNEQNVGESDEAILLVAHDGTIKAVYADYANLDMGQLNSTHVYDHDFVARFTMKDGKVNSFDELGG
jgi:broad specificity phosphatase PhoE